MDQDARRFAYLVLRHGDQVTPGAFARLLQTHGSLEALLASADGAHLTPGLANPDRITRAQVAAELRWADQADQHLLTFDCPAYPEMLKTIASPPPVLSVRGNVASLQQPQLAMVGSRRCSAYGAEVGHWLAFELAGCGLTITSGLARGIDTQAHQGALAAGGSTIAVVATGLDRIYPRSNAGLAAQCCRNGALISEFALGTPPLPVYFPQRNRIISGLAHGVLVVEASLGSGSLITARLAMEQNREVFAVPGQVNRAASEGCHQLIKTGAKLVEQPGDVLTELTPQVLDRLHPDSRMPGSHALRRSAAKATGLDRHSQAILRTLAREDLMFESLQARCRLPTDALAATLLQLEIQGLVCQRDGRIAVCDTPTPSPELSPAPTPKPTPKQS